MKLKLILKDGTEFAGTSFGYWPDSKKAETFSVDGEVVFNTSMVGYPETFTDPSYRGQILVLTYPLIGNYGVPMEKQLDNVSQLLESNEVHLRAIIVSEYSEEFSHWEAKKSLADFLKRHKVPAIQNIDTRALTKKLREHGVMLGKITAESAKYSKKMEFTDPNAANLVAEVSIETKQILPAEGKAKATVIAIDCGMKHNILRNFTHRGVKVVRVPWDFDLSKYKGDYDGLFVSNGPGDPKMATNTIESVKFAMKENKPVFGICLGSQIMGLAVGANTYKLKYGHRSANQPCTVEDTVRCYITSQNHGYAVDEKTLPKDWKVWFRNANDGTVEGIKHVSKPWFSVQFHPEASPGPEDPSFLFDNFIEKITK
jgi:carbamoyl-phosphate synthase small subunit